MNFQIILNILVAFIWMFLWETFDFSTFVIGYFVGMFLLFLMRRFIPDSFYLDRVYAICKLILLFIKELILANLSVVKFVYKPNLKTDTKPGIFALPIDLKTNWEITLLANLITLTPGTLSVAVSNDYSVIYIHAMDIPNVEEQIDGIKNTFEKAIMEVTR
ncbi:Na+/H+ antiporter subunit E [Bacillus solimangrovi]|uniref:Cation:proton antiporter n=1 Tax=Bacillus solimangrovi TaxID=1305675 RepID=A0A1E5LHY9_9BACI|nr:Na+/H+ antiporter subunit E [Bacillus solimangrovi]OEH93666.1 cation:proton antiporter [Bacillus solimangrovi]